MPERCESEVGGGRRAGRANSRDWRVRITWLQDSRRLQMSNNRSRRQQLYATAILLIHGVVLMGCDAAETCVLMEKRIERGVAVGGALAHPHLARERG